MLTCTSHRRKQTQGGEGNMLRATHLSDGKTEVGPQVCLLLSALPCSLYIANWPMHCFALGSCVCGSKQEVEERDA